MLGKSGKHYNNPHVARDHGDAPEMAEEQHHEASHGHEGEKAKTGHKGRHTLTKHEDGGYSSDHESESGEHEPMDHPDFAHAMKHMAGKFGEPHESKPEDEHEAGSEPEDKSYGDGAGAIEGLYEPQ